MASCVLLIRPREFQYNQETANDNKFASSTNNQEIISQKAKEEFNAFVECLNNNDIETIVFDDLIPSAGPDVVFPNNWFSTHENNTVILYPMRHQSRRCERRQDIIKYLTDNFVVNKVFDLSDAELNGIYLEGTGSMVIDHEAKIVYAAKSQRTDSSLVKKVCDIICNYKPCVFETNEKLGGQPIYHTNVMMAVLDKVVLCCTDLLKKSNDLEKLEQFIVASKKTLLPITIEQVNQFLGNILQVKDKNGNLCTIMSLKAYNSLTESQLNVIEETSKIVKCPIETIENVGGGGVRCMMAEIWLKRKNMI